jgi:hypothetical protein
MGMFTLTDPELEFAWLHLQYEEKSTFVETYGFAGNQGMVNLEGILIRPKGQPSSTLLIFMHPTSTLQLLPVPRAAARHGAHVLCAASRYAKNDAALIMEKVILDLGAYVRHAKEVLGYQKVVIVGWSGGGSLALFYQSQAENPTIVSTPAGDPIDIAGAGLTTPSFFRRPIFPAPDCCSTASTRPCRARAILTTGSGNWTSTTKRTRISRRIRRTSSPRIGTRSGRESTASGVGSGRRWRP